MKRIYILAMLASVIGLSGSSCPFPPQPSKPRVAALRGFSSPEELRQYLADQATANVNGNGSRAGGGIYLFGVPMPSLLAPTAGAEDTTGTSNTITPAPPDPFSTTNIQEVGVDESDIVKNDGQTIFALDGNTIHIVQATPPSGVAEVAKVTVDSSGDSLYLHGHTLIALSRQYAYFYGFNGGGGVGVGIVPVATSTTVAPLPPDMSSSPVASPPTVPTTPIISPPNFKDGSQTTVTIIDVSNPAVPAVQATVRFEGDLAGSRMIGNKLHLVLTTVPRLPDNPTPLAIRNMPLEDWIPNFQVLGSDGGVVASGDIAGWEGFFRPITPDGYGITTVVTMDVDNPTAAFASTAISADAGLIYASPAALYISDTSYDYQNPGISYEDTIIHKLAFTDAGTDYIASGLVPGRPLNSYSLGEFNDFLRIATHVSNFNANTFTSRESNSVYVLGESTSGPTLDIVGKIEDIAPGEQIYSSRFVGDRGFLVTFHRVDPLFTLDLSVPTQPKIAGKLKVPGYSDHLQLLDENHLLTIGKDVQDAGSFAWIEGVQVSLFDITDFANPTLLDKEVIGGRGTSSEANYNPKAFNYFAAKNALAFPIDDYSGQTTGPEIGSHDFTGLYVYHVTVADGIQFLGRIATTSGVQPNGCYFGYYGYTRGVFIGDTIYAVTQIGAKAASLDNVSVLIGQTTYPEVTAPTEDCTFAPPSIVIPFGEGLR